MMSCWLCQLDEDEVAVAVHVTGTGSVYLLHNPLAMTVVDVQGLPARRAAVHAVSFTAHAGLLVHGERLTFHTHLVARLENVGPFFPVVRCVTLAV